MAERRESSTGIGQLDNLLGGLYIGDNVVWLDSNGSLAHLFCLNLIRKSRDQERPLIYVDFDRSPRNLLDKLGDLAHNPHLIILDCFTNGKGGGTAVFRKFYDQSSGAFPCRILQLDDPRDPRRFMDALYTLHGTLDGDVHFVFESLTGMQELWGGEEQILSFYSHSCPRLYELNTVAYWIMERSAHSPRLRASISQIAQVVIDLSIRRGTTSLTIMKAENRDIETLQKPQNYWSRGLNVAFDTERRTSGLIDLGWRLKELRTKRGFSQSELAKRVGVTPSTISQVESNLIYPSLPALFKMAEVLDVEMSSFFHEGEDVQNRFIFPLNEATEVSLSDFDVEHLQARMLIPFDFGAKVEPYSIEIPPGATLSSHFFTHKGEEFGYLLSGRLQVRVRQTMYTVQAGDVFYLKTEIPSQWRNAGTEPARLLWLKVR